MIYYWALFSLPVVSLLSPVYLSPRLRFSALIVLTMAVILLIGFRYEIGGDWCNYLDKYQRIHDEGIHIALRERSKGYGLVNWLSAQFNWGIYGVNAICGVMFSAGLAFFCSRQPLPWLAWVVAIPYLVIVVGMGYTSQSVAVGLVLCGFVFLEDRRPWQFVAVVVAASVFHISAILMLPLVVFSIHRNLFRFFINKTTSSLVVLVLVGLMVMAIFSFIFYDDMRLLYHRYVEGDLWDSSGAYIRSTMNAMPALILLLFSKRFRKYFQVRVYWYPIACVALVTPFAAILATTAVDRISIYLMAVQMYVWSRAPLLTNDRNLSAAITVGIIFFYGLVLWVWLNYAHHNYAWIPYGSILLQDFHQSYCYHR